MNEERLLSEFIAECTARLRATGFRKRAGEIFTCAVADGVLGWLGLNRGHRGTAIEINPVVGVRHEQVERAVAAALGERFHPYVPPTVSISIGYIASGSYQSWLLERPEDVAEAAAEIARVVDVIGLPFMRSNVALDELVASLERHLTASPEQAAMRLPVALKLAGESDRARTLVEQELDRIAERQDMAAAAYRRFAEGFERAA